MNPAPLIPGQTIDSATLKIYADLVPESRVRVCSDNPFYCSDTRYFGSPIIESISDSVCFGDTLILSLDHVNSSNWFGTDFYLLGNDSVAVFPSTSASYTVDAVHEYGCIMSLTKEVTVVKMPEIELDSTQLFCNDQDDQIRLVVGDDFDPDLNYEWFPDYNLVNADSNYIEVSPFKDTMYYVEVSLSNGSCLERDSIFVISEDCKIVEGKVMRFNNDNGLGNSTIQLYGLTGNGQDFAYIKEVLSNLGGQYQIRTSDSTIFLRAIPTGNYATSHLATFADSALVIDLADTVYLTADTTVRNFRALKRSVGGGIYNLSGKIFDYYTGDPVQGLELIVTDTAIHADTVRYDTLSLNLAVTYPTGLFYFSSLKPGGYEIWAVTPTFAYEIAPIFLIQDSSLTNLILYLKGDTLLSCSAINNTLPCGIIEGQIFNDLDFDCEKEVGEEPYALHTVEVMPGSFYTQTDQNGRYRFAIEQGDYTVRTTLPQQPYWEESCTGGSLIYQLNLGGSANQVDTLNFGFRQNPNIYDLSVSVTPFGAIRPGFDYTVNVTIENIGTATATGSNHFHLSIPENSSFVSSTVMVSDNDGSLLTWEYTDLAVGSSISTNVVFTLEPAPMLIGELLAFTAYHTLAFVDINPLNDLDSASVEITGSYDPNDKSASPQGMGPEGFILPSDATEFVYTVRFQNTGNDTAFNIVILDTLHQSFDPLSLRVIATSHTCQTEILDNGVAKFSFQDIMLPDSNTNIVESNGFIKYQIEPSEPLKVGDILTNQAAIYFDFNPPIITNTVTHTIVESLTSSNQLGQQPMKITLFPNPTTSEDFWLKLQILETVTINISIADIMGQVIASPFNQLKLQPGLHELKITTKGWPSGVYMVLLQTEQGWSTQKIVKY